MEVQLTIRGSYGEVTELIRTLADHPLSPSPKMEGEGAPIQHTPEPSFSRSLEDDQEPPYYEAVHRSQEMKCAPLPGPPQNMEGAGLGKPKGNERHCHFRGKIFPAPRKDSKFCSKKCNMKEWYELHKTKAVKEVAPDAIKTAPDAMKSAPDAIYPVAVLVSEEKAKALAMKLDKIKLTCPAPTKRPDIDRGL